MLNSSSRLSSRFSEDCEDRSDEEDNGDDSSNFSSSSSSGIISMALEFLFKLNASARNFDKKSSKGNASNEIALY